MPQQEMPPRQPKHTTLSSWVLSQAKKSSAAGWVLLLAVVLALPSLSSGLIADDHYIFAHLHDNTLLPSLGHYPGLELFSISDGEPATVQYLVSQGVLPWWSDLHFKFHQWRPLAAWSHWLDDRLWPGQLWLMHAHQLIWFGLLLCLVLTLYRRLLPEPGLATLAFALYALSANFSQTITWLAARNTLMATTLGIATLLAHIHGRNTDNHHWTRLAWALYAATLLASEYGLAVSGWLLAWTLTLYAGNLWQKLRQLLPYGMLGLIWLALYIRGGYGVGGSEYYLDPLRETGRYLEALPHRSMDLLFLTVFGFSPGQIGAGKLVSWLAAMALLLILGRILHPFRHQTRFQFWLIGLVLSVLLAAAGAGGGRTLSFVSLGMAPLVAQALLEWMQGDKRHATINSLLGFLSACLVIGAIARPITALIMSHYDLRYISAPALALPVQATASQRTLVLLNADSLLRAIFYPVVRAEMGLPRPFRLLPLASGDQPIHLERDSTHSLVLIPDHGFLQETAAYFVRPKNTPLQVGEQLTYPGMTVTILAVNPEQRPSQVQFRFEDNLDESSIQLLQCDRGGFKPLQPPTVGEHILLPICTR